MNLTTSQKLKKTDEVTEALSEKRPIVALESTLISHGLPWPENLETAIACEELVRQSGSTPATIAVIHGVIRIGLNRSELEMLSNPETVGIQKASRRDLGTLVSQGLSAATTVSATMFLARSVGIQFMCTGGLGGVHRGADSTFDISMDLDELARAHGMALVCSGVKSILDISATLEKMETLGISVVGYQTKEFPAFTELTSGITLDHYVNSAEEAAKQFLSHFHLGIPGAVVFAQPCPESMALDSDLAKQALEKALNDAQRLQVRGKAVTPYLLSRMRDLTQGHSLNVNKELIKKNAATSGQIAAAAYQFKTT
jgi:pseudouridylate synthase